MTKCRLSSQPTRRLGFTVGGFGENYSELLSKYHQSVRVRLSMAEEGIVKTQYLVTLCAVLVVGATLIAASATVSGKATEKTSNVQALQEKGTSYALIIP